MDPRTKKRLAQEFNEHLDHGTTDYAAEPVHASTSRYSDPATAAAEVTALFRRLPLVLAHETRIPNPGDYITHELAGLPLLLVRQADGGVRTMLNACRHRGARLVFDEAGNRRAALACRYHAWSYSLDGSLRAIPGEAGFCSLDRAAHGLVQFPTEVRHGLVWAVLTPGAELDVATYLGPELDTDLAEHRIGDHRVAHDTVIRRPINWKMVIDGFLENYHFKPLHSKTVGPYYKGDLCISDEFGPHIRHTVPRETFDSVRHLSADEYDLLHHAAVGYILFPNTVLLSTADKHGSHFEMWHSYPDRGAPGQAVASAQMLVPVSEAPTDQRRAFWSRNWEVAMTTVTTEDLWICEGTQQSAETGLLGHYVFGANEPALQHFHRHVDLALHAAADQVPTRPPGHPEED